ncbi:MAG: protease modulator HflC [Verrucomicrobiota bacterium]|jgi:modulator of FtsH protease HflC
MKRNSFTVTVGVILLAIFVLLLFTFQVRQTEVALVTTFDKPTRIYSDPLKDPGMHWKWPAPIQKVYKFDRRIQNFEGKFEETQTQDNLPILVMVYVGWTIKDPSLFFSSFPGGTTTQAEPALEGLIRSAQSSVIGKHPFGHFISTDEKQLKFVEIEKEMIETIQPNATKYGIQIDFLGIKKLGLPQSVTEKVFARMKAEREREIARLKARGEAEAMKIQSTADRDRAEILAKAEAQATAIRGQADAESSKALAVFEQSPELAIFLRKLKALEETLKDRSTLILDERTSPFDLLTRPQAPNANATK